MMNKIAAFFLVFSISSYVNAIGGYVQKNDPYAPEALEQARVIAEKYVIRCGQSSYARVSDSYWFEFKSATPDVRIFGVYKVGESEKMNGMTWHGKLEANFGKVYRAVIVQNGSVEISPWKDAQPLEYELALNNGVWKLARPVYFGALYELKETVSCSKVPVIAK